MIFLRLDENVSHRIADAARAIGIPQDLKIETAHGQRESGLSDVDWVSRFAQRGRSRDVRAAFSGDGRMRDNEAERVALEDAGIVLFFAPGKGFLARVEEGGTGGLLPPLAPECPGDRQEVEAWAAVQASRQLHSTGRPHASRADRTEEGASAWPSAAGSQASASGPSLGRNRSFAQAWTSRDRHAEAPKGAHRQRPRWVGRHRPECRSQHWIFGSVAAGATSGRSLVSYKHCLLPSPDRSGKRSIALMVCRILHSVTA